MLGVRPQYLHPLPLDTPTTIQGVDVTLVTANHCPGAVQLLFRLPDGRRYVHTGPLGATGGPGARRRCACSAAAAGAGAWLRVALPCERRLNSPSLSALSRRHAVQPGLAGQPTLAGL